jgi:hypothetical protein
MPPKAVFGRSGVTATGGVFSRSATSSLSERHVVVRGISDFRFDTLLRDGIVGI